MCHHVGMKNVNTSTQVAIAIGSNLGERLFFLRSALEDIKPYIGITAVSRIYETPPAYVTDQPPFLNACLIGTAHLAPLALLWSLKYVEGQLGRQPTFRYGPRVIDLDLIFFGTDIITDPELTIPHPRLAEREFVLRPLADIAPNWKHPLSGLTIQEMLNELPQQTAIPISESLTSL